MNIALARAQKSNIGFRTGERDRLSRNPIHGSFALETTVCTPDLMSIGPDHHLTPLLRKLASATHLSARDEQAILRGRCRSASIQTASAPKPSMRST
jgi:hypothetical protein